MRKVIAIVLLLISSASRLLAQEDSTAIKDLEEVVLTGQYKPQTLKNSVYQVKVIDNQRIRYSGATSIQQVLINQLGFRLSNDNTLGTTDVQLMGMSGRNVKILLDGVPLIDRGDTRESLGQVDINSIDRIEIVEGPMAVSYGSDALAGVINIITKRPIKNTFSITGRAQEETVANEYYPFSYKGVHTQNLSLNWANEKWSILLGGGHNDFDGAEGDDYGRGKTWRPKEQWLGNARIGYHAGKISLYYRLDGLNEEITYRYPINFSNYKAVDQFYITKRFMHQLQNQWKISNKMNLASVLAYTEYNRRTKTTIHDFAANTSVPGTNTGQQDESKFQSFVFRNTFSYQVSDKLSFQPGIDINHEKATGARINGSPVINDYAFFISSEIKPTSSINIRPGLRFIKNSVYDAPPVIPSLNTKFVLNKNLDLRASYAYGFRSPALRELYFNFIDANHIILGNTNLEAEYSNSYTASLSWQPQVLNSHWKSAVLGGFYNSFHNLISYAASPTSNDTTVTVNIDRFKTTGATLENQFACKNLSVTLGFAYIGRFNALSENETYKSGLPDFVWTPEVNTNIVYNIKKINTTVGFFYKYTGKRPGYQLVTPAGGQQQVQKTEIDGFHWADLTITKSLFRYFSLMGGIKNLFDVTNLSNSASSGGGAHSTGGAVPMAYGRSYFLGLTASWTKK